MEPLLKGGGGGVDVQFNRDTALSVLPSNVKTCRSFGQDLLRSQRLTNFPIKAYHETTKVKGNRLPRHQRHQRGGEGRVERVRKTIVEGNVRFTPLPGSLWPLSGT